MGLDWGRVKELTLWQYEEIIEKLLHVLSYNFVQKKYNRKLNETRKMFLEFFKNRDDDKYSAYSASVSDTLRQVEIFGIRNIAELVETIQEQNDCTNFVEISNVSFEGLIQLLNCCLRWLLPFARPIIDFIDTDNKEHITYLSSLRKRGIKNNLDMIEKCHTAEGRQTFAVLTDVPLDFILELTHRTDISRIPYIRGKSVRIFNAAGYETLEEIANASAEKMIAKLEESLRSEGKKFSRSFIDPEGAITQAKVIPSLFEV